ncbi:MAG: amidohydrolase family protein [Acidimicrobiales bacterium]|nr:amidohydrolase family protein [Acidimicrobiales bacterium]
MTDRVLLVSSDCHTGLPVERYRPYLDPSYRDDFDDYASGISNLALREGASRLSRERFLARYGERIERAWDSSARLEDLEQDGVVAEVMFPGAGFKETAVPWSDIFSGRGTRNRTPRARELATAGERAYNRWLAEFCAEAPGRRVGLAIVPLHDLDAAEAELRWAAGAGLGGVMFPVFHYDLPEYCDETYWERFWSACEELGFALHVHGGVGLPDFGRHTAAMMGLELDYAMTRPFWHLVFSGVFDRHPNLHLVMTEPPRHSRYRLSCTASTSTSPAGDTAPSTSSPMHASSPRANTGTASATWARRSWPAPSCRPATSWG